MARQGLTVLLRSRILNYEGRITAYHGHGVFELDNKKDRKLFLSHYHTPHLERLHLSHLGKIDWLVC